MGEYSYLTLEELCGIYDKTIEKSGGGLSGIRDEGGLIAILEFMQNDTYYPLFEDKLSYLVFSLCRGHYFLDGNKRIALTAGTHFLLVNGYYWAAKTFMAQLESIIYYVAASRISDDLLRRIISFIMRDEDYDEETKLDIVHSIQDNL